MNIFDLATDNNYDGYHYFKVGDRVIFHYYSQFKHCGTYIIRGRAKNRKFILTPESHPDISIVAAGYQMQHEERKT